MDFASIIGFVAGLGILSLLIHDGGGLARYLNDHALIVIFGGATAATFIRFELSAILGGVPTGLKLVFKGKHTSPRNLIERVAELAEILRKQGPLGLEQAPIADPFLAKGVRLISDGFDRDVIRENLERERDLNLHRLDMAQQVYRAYGDCAPAFGMIGTLIGLVQMFAEMDDPSKLGPLMAIALIATLYGAVIANFFCMPIADKLKMKFTEDEINQSLIIDGILLMRENKSPALIRQMLISYLPEKQRAQMEEAA